jgi:DNA topoisomerase-1
MCSFSSASAGGSLSSRKGNRNNRTLVVVESPTKAKKVSKFLSDVEELGQVEVLASYGHVIDLESKGGAGVDPENNFYMNWKVQEKSEDKLRQIMEAAIGCDRVLLATDPDREGEGIAWHLEQHLLKTIKEEEEEDLLKVGRITFNEVTKQAVLRSLEEIREVSTPLVDAYRARRALDYLVGMNLSPVLWYKLPQSRSAGRVQSAALRMICERDIEISNFDPEEYWSVNCEVKVKDATTSQQHHTFDSHLTVLEGKKLGKFSIPAEEEALAAIELIQDQCILVQKVKETTSKKTPKRPLTTSTLQQLASSRLGMSSSETMRLAQKLYEGDHDHSGEGEGLITYMRTDGTFLAPSFVSSARDYIQDRFGEEYLPAKARVYASRSKNAQEAHEAIRPTDVTMEPKFLAKKLDEKALKLYTLIWSISVACQMSDARVKTLSFDFGDEDGQVLLRSSMSAVAFAGHQALLMENKDEEENRANLKLLEALSKIQPKTECGTSGHDPVQHFTAPPPKYSDGSLVKALEEEGIGRPSTYAPIVQVLMGRQYVVRDSGRLVPTPKGHLVITFLKHYFEQYVDYSYTSGMEENLDKISNNELEWTSLLDDFWVSFNPQVSDVLQVRKRDVIDELDNLMGDSLLKCLNLDTDHIRQCPKCKTGTLGLKFGKYGGFIGCSNFSKEEGEEGEACDFAVPLDMCFDSKLAKHEFDITALGWISDGEGVETTYRLNLGPFGYYLQNPGGETLALPRTIQPREVDIDVAQWLFSLPKLLGDEVYVNMSSFGLFVECGDKRAYLRDYSVSDLLALKLEGALVLMEEKGRVTRKKTFGGKKKNTKAAAKKKGTKKKKAKATTTTGGEGRGNGFVDYMKKEKDRVRQDHPEKTWTECLKILGAEYRQESKQKVV